MRFTIAPTRSRTSAGIEEAIADYDAVLALRPRHVAALNRRGNALAALKRPEEALAAYDAALAIEPDNAEVLNNRSVDAGRARTAGRGAAKLRRALALRPEYADAHYNRGNALRCDSGGFEEARASYAAALALEPQSRSMRSTISAWRWSGSTGMPRR